MSEVGRIRLVVSDIDGTLVRDDKSLSDGVTAAVRRLTAAGTPFTLISARPPSGILWMAEQLGLDGPLAAFNGGTLVKRDGTIVSANRLAPETAARTLALLDEPGVEPWLFADGKWYARTTENAHVEREKRSANIDPTIVPGFDALLGAVDKIVGVSEDHERLAALETKVAAALGDDATVARSQPYYLDITARRGNKGDGLRALAGSFSVSLANVAVFGDQRNDLPMFAIAGLSVAMGQGPQEVRDAATEVTHSNMEDGVAHAIDEVILGRDPAP